MLLANRSVAKHIAKPHDKNAPKIPFIYRCHDKPSPEKIALFDLFVQKFGYEVDLSDERTISNGLMLCYKIFD